MSTATESGSAEVHSETVPDDALARGSRRLYLPTIVIASLAAWLSWRGWNVLGQFGPARSINAGRFELAGPVVIGFVLAVFTIEQLWPAERRPVLARGHLLDLAYLVFYTVLVVPLIVLIGSGFAGLLARLEPWLVLPRVPAVPGWCFVALAVSITRQRAGWTSTSAPSSRSGTCCRRAVFPQPGGDAIRTGLAGRPVPVEQSRRAPPPCPARS